MSSVGNVEVSVAEDWLRPRLRLVCRIECGYDELCINISGLLMSEDNKVLCELIPIEIRSRQHIMAKNNIYFNKLKESKQTIECILVAPLSKEAIEHIEELREKNPKKDVILNLVFYIGYIKSLMCTAHIHEVPIDHQRMPTIAKDLVNIRVGSRGKIPESILVYSYDPEYTAGRTVTWILSAYGTEPIIVQFYVSKSTKQLRIPLMDWINDYLPKLLKKKATILEIPIPEVEIAVEELRKAIEELEYAYSYYRKGDFEGVLNALRRSLHNNILVVKEIEEKGEKKKARCLRPEIKDRILSGIPDNAKSTYKEVLKYIEESLLSIWDYLCKFVHEETGKLLTIPLPSDIKYLIEVTASTYRHLMNLLSLKYTS